MDIKQVLTSGAALVFVLALMGLIAFLFKKFGDKAGLNFANSSKRRIQIKEVLNIDAKKKIVLISRDEKEHLIALSDNAIEVIETDIKIWTKN